jgi:hypothetical protein
MKDLNIMLVFGKNKKEWELMKPMTQMKNKAKMKKKLDHQQSMMIKLF